MIDWRRFRNSRLRKDFISIIDQQDLARFGLNLKADADSDQNSKTDKSRHLILGIPRSTSVIVADKFALEDFMRWSKVVKPDQGDDMFRCNGAGGMLVFSAADFEDFLEPRPDLPEKLAPERTDRSEKRDHSSG